MGVFTPGCALTSEGATIDIAPDLTGWTATQVYDLLKLNAYRLSLIEPSLKVKVQTQYGSATCASASSSGGVYRSFNATIYLDARPDRLFSIQPETTVVHEYGHVWTYCWYYMAPRRQLG